MVKPQLPESVELVFPEDVLRIIYSYVSHIKKTPSTESSPSLEKELRKIQNKAYKGKNALYMKDFDDFVLDRYDCY
jgi:hypothetical protein